MAANVIVRKDLWRSLDSIKDRQQWFAAAERLGFDVTASRGGTSHAVIRVKGVPAEDPRGVVATVQAALYKQVNRAIFKNLLARGIAEDDLWRALGLLR